MTYAMPKRNSSVLIAALLVASIGLWLVSVPTAFSQSVTQVSILPATQSVVPGSNFQVSIEIDPTGPVAGVQFELVFDPAVIRAQSVADGTFLDQNGANTFFNPGTIDNINGAVTGVAGAIISPGQTVASSGMFSTLTFSVVPGVTDDISSMQMAGVIVGDINGEAVPVDLPNLGKANVVIHQSAATEVSISPLIQDVAQGALFELRVEITPSAPVSGAQFELSFDPTLTLVESVTEGGFLNQDGANTFFNPGTIDNINGTVTGVAGAIISPGQTVSTSGVLATVEFRAKTTATGNSTIEISNVIVGDADGQAVPVEISNDGKAQIVFPPGDVVVMPIVPATAVSESEFEVLIAADKVEMLAGAEVELHYDPALLTAVDVRVAAPFGGLGCNNESNDDPLGGVLIMSFACSTGGNSGEPLLLWAVTFRSAHVASFTQTQLETTGVVLASSQVPSQHIPAQGSAATLDIISGLCGDQDSNGKVEVVDVVIDLQITVGIVIPSLEQLVLSDLTRDGEINVLDAIVGLKHLVGEIPILRGCGPSPVLE